MGQKTLLMGSQKQHQISIGVKIFGMATSMLALLGVVVFVSSNRLRQVNQEIQSLANYTIPITNLIAQVNIHTLEQEQQVERLLRLYEIYPPDGQQIDLERQQFEKRGSFVDGEMSRAIELAISATDRTRIKANRQQWSEIEPRLQAIEKKHHIFFERAVVILQLLEDDKFTEARQLTIQLETEETSLTQEMENLLLELEDFTIQASKNSIKHQRTVQYISRSAAAIATVFGLLYASVVTSGLVQPVRKLIRTIKSVQAGNLDSSVEVHSGDEIATMSQAFNAMVSELKLKEKLEETFGKYVDPRVVKRLTNNSEDTQTQGDRKVMTVFFSDIKGFNAIADTLTPDKLVQFTNEYLTLMSAPISDHSGVIDKFIGTIAMGFWGPPFTSETEHAKLACYAALDQIARLEKLGQLVAEVSGDMADPPTVDLHIGIASGAAVVGNMGSDRAKSYTVMGDTVNTASRLKGVGQQYGIQVALLEETRNMAGEAIETREIDRIQVVGKEDPVRVYELLGRRGQISQETLYRRDTFEKGLVAYRQQDWERAQQYFTACLQIEPSDRPASLYLDRVKTLRDNPPPEDWDGVWRLTRK